MQLEFSPSTNNVQVYHLGEHKCSLKLDKCGTKEALKRKSETRRIGSAKRVAIQEVENLTAQGMVEEAEAAADNWLDARLAKRVMAENNQEADVVAEDNNSFDMVGIIKRQTDDRDPFYIYRINNGIMNSQSDYVFKSSTVMAQITIQMGIDGLSISYRSRMHF